MDRKIGGVLWRSMPREISRRRDDHAMHRANQPGSAGRFRECANANAHIDRVADHVLSPVVEHQFDMKTRMAFGEGGEPWNDHLDTHGRRHGDPQRALQVAAFPDAALRVFQRRKDKARRAREIPRLPRSGPPLAWYGTGAARRVRLRARQSSGTLAIARDQIPAPLRKSCRAGPRESRG